MVNRIGQTRPIPCLPGAYSLMNSLMTEKGNKQGKEGIDDGTLVVNKDDEENQRLGEAVDSNAVGKLFWRVSLHHCFSLTRETAQSLSNSQFGGEVRGVDLFGKCNSREWQALYFLCPFLQHLEEQRMGVRECPFITVGIYMYFFVLTMLFWVTLLYIQCSSSGIKFLTSFFCPLGGFFFSTHPSKSWPSIVFLSQNLP